MDTKYLDLLEQAALKAMDSPKSAGGVDWYDATEIPIEATDALMVSMLSPGVVLDLIRLAKHE